LEDKKGKRKKEGHRHLCFFPFFFAQKTVATPKEEGGERVERERERKGKPRKEEKGEDEEGEEEGVRGQK